MKIRVGDKVTFIYGKNKHKAGEEKSGVVVKVIAEQEKIVVKDRNLLVKHIKKTATEAGRKVTFEAAVHVSKVMLVCPSCKKLTRVGYRKDANNKKIRFCKKCDSPIETSQVKSKA
jgi:large subunit ribosomal protein L24